MFIVPMFSLLLTTTQDMSARLKADAMDARQQIVVTFKKVGQTFKTLGEDVGHEAKEGGRAVGHGTVKAGKAVGSRATSFGRAVKKRWKKIGRGAKEAVD